MGYKYIRLNPVDLVYLLQPEWDKKKEEDKGKDDEVNM
jgi:hypothetical protein